MEGCIGSRVRNIRRRESFFPLIRFVPGSCFGCLLLTSPPTATVLVDEERHRWCTKGDGIIRYIRLTYSVPFGAHFDALRAPQHPARRPSFHASSSRFFPGRHCDRSSSFHLEISRAPEAGAMPAYILKVLAPAAQSFIRHSHATLPSAACSPIELTFRPRSENLVGGAKNL